MLFVVIGTPRSNFSEAAQRRILQLFTNWKEPSGFTTKALYGLVDGSFVGVAEAETAAAMLEQATPFNSFFDFKVSPAVEADAVVPLLQRVYSWAAAVQ